MTATSQTIISFENVSKRFFRGGRHTTLSEVIPATVRRLLRAGRSRTEEFWALRDVSFILEAGQALAIIGPNGSGKSTALKLITGILRPDRGQVAVHVPRHGRGRIGALIELSAGFHFELSGRENIYLQGAILGMRRAEIARQFDEIVAFAEVAEFVDTPVKRYSTGMIARLGFAIAAHLEPDVLLIDEVLAVGDRMFQRRAFDRIQKVVANGVPAVVVSHQLHHVLELCDRGLLLTQGAVVCSGTAAECVAQYVTEGVPVADDDSSPIHITGLEGPVPSHVAPGERMVMRVQGLVRSSGNGANATIGVRVRQLPREELVFVAHSAGCGLTLPEGGPFELEIDLQMNVGPGLYRAQAAAWDLGDLRELSRGPSTLIGVGSEPAASGLVFASPRMRFLGS